MKNIYIILIIAIFSVSCSQKKVAESNLKFPKPIGYVNDFEGILTEPQIDTLTQMLAKYDKKTSNQITIVTTDSIGTYQDMKSYATDLGNEWGVGQKDKNNGLLIVLSTTLRTDYIATGKGTEKVLTDSICEFVRETYMLPEYKQVKFYEGLKKGTEKFIEIWGK